MRHSLTIIGVGLISGTIGALLSRRFPSTSAPAASAPAVLAVTREPPRAVIVPPGWDPQVLSRLASVEQKVDDLSVTAAAVTPPASATPSSSGGAREVERQKHYERELALQEARIQEHNAEPVDEVWSREQVAAFRQVLARPSENGPAPPRATQVDCRTKTCVATLTFGSPGDGLTYLAARAPVAEGCNGYISTPVPPTSAGSYDLTVVYTCR